MEEIINFNELNLANFTQEQSDTFWQMLEDSEKLIKTLNVED